MTPIFRRVHVRLQKDARTQLMHAKAVEASPFHRVSSHPADAAAAAVTGLLRHLRHRDVEIESSGT